MPQVFIIYTIIVLKDLQEIFEQTLKTVLVFVGRKRLIKSERAVN